MTISSSCRKESSKWRELVIRKWGDKSKVARRQASIGFSLFAQVTMKVSEYSSKTERSATPKSAQISNGCLNLLDEPISVQRKAREQANLRAWQKRFTSNRLLL